MNSSYQSYYEKTPARFSDNSTEEISDVTRNAYLNGMEPGPMRSGSGRGGRWNPMNWKLWQKLVGVAIIVVIIIAIIVGAVVGSRANRYPSYSPLTYSLKDTYAPSGTSGFFDSFDYFEGYDPTQGFVHYDPQPAATQANLTSVQNSQAIIKVDDQENNAITGRHSVRLTSKNQYNDGLFLFDVAHSPYGCGTWPSIWLVDPSNWPANGEIDVLEATNKGDSGNQMTLHTTSGCDMSGVKRMETGNAISTSCVNTTDDNAGCAVKGATDTYGAAFNTNGGGVYAMEWRGDGIRTWFFPRSSIPTDVSSGNSPNPSSWGTALADFPNTNCDIGSHFKNMSIVIDIDLCGSWAGSPTTYGQSGCPSNCTDFVANNPTAFSDAYWAINGFKVFTAPNAASG